VTASSAGSPLELGEAQLRMMLDCIPARAAVLDRGRRHWYANHEYQRFTGRRKEEIVGRTVAEIIGAEAAARTLPLCERALAGESVEWSGWLPYDEGARLRFVQRFYMPYRGPRDEIDGYFVLARDLTDLKLSDALAAATIASALDCIVMIDESGAIIEFNPAAEATFGHSREFAVGRQMAELLIPPALRAGHHVGMQRYLATSEAKFLGRRIEIEALRADGEIFPIELAITEIRLAGRRMFTAHLRDISASRKAVAEIQRQREALQQSEKMAAFGSLLAGVAHELNNPLSIAIGHALMLEEEMQGTKAGDRSGKIRAAAERCARVVRSFLAIARQRKATLEALDVAALVEGVVQLLSYGLASSGVEVERALPANLPPVLGDADQLHQVLANLLTNAQQALESRPHPRRIRIAACAPGDQIEIVVSDNGPGIPAELRGRIFDPFFTTKPVGAGTGIGLSISRGMVEAHGGSMALAPPEPGGATFVIRLPAATHVAASPAAPAVERRPAAAPARHALIVDDEPEVAELLAEMLTAQGLRCQIAPDGAKAQALLESRDFDVILCDLRMPMMDGRTLLGWLGSHRPALRNRLAFITGDTLGPGAGADLLELGRPILEKPFTSADVRALVASLIADAHPAR
jgi:two-component system NtrC family sensor kinase